MWEHQNITFSLIFTKCHMRWWSFVLYDWPFLLAPPAHCLVELDLVWMVPSWTHQCLSFPWATVNWTDTNHNIYNTCERTGQKMWPLMRITGHMLLQWKLCQNINKMHRNVTSSLSHSHRNTQHFKTSFNLSSEVYKVSYFRFCVRFNNDFGSKIKDQWRIQMIQVMH